MSGLRRTGQLRADPVKAAERRRRREARRATEGPRPEDEAREERAAALRGRGTAPEPRAPSAIDTSHVARSSHEWWRIVTAGGCVMCAEFPVDPQTALERAADLDWIQGHHPIERQDLKRWGLACLLWDTRNGLGICAYHHARHTHAVQRIPRRLLRRETFEFADAIDARHVLEDPRVYPLDG